MGHTEDDCADENRNPDEVDGGDSQVSYADATLRRCWQARWFCQTTSNSAHNRPRRRSRTVVCKTESQVTLLTEVQIP
jgi:hypothetical protein